MENVPITIDVKSGEGLKSIKQMKDEILSLTKAMGEAAAAGDKATFNKLAKNIGELKNDMVDLKDKMKYADPGELVAGVAKLAGGVAGAFSAVSAGFDLLAGDNKKMQEIMGKTAKVIQLIQGLESARQLLEGKGLIQGLALQAKNIALKMGLIAVTKAQTVATQEGEAAQIAMNVAAYANPYVLLAAAIVALVVAVAAYSSGARDMAEQNVKTIEGLEKLSEAGTENNAVVELAIAQQKAELIVNEALADVFEKVRVALGGLTDAQIDHLQSTKDMGETAQELGEKQIKLAEAQGKSENELLRIKQRAWYMEAYTRNQLLKTNTELSNDEKKAQQERITELVKLYKEADLDIKFNAIKEKVKQEEEKAKLNAEAAKKYAEDWKKTEADLTKSLLDQREKNILIEISLIEDEQERKFALLAHERDKALEKLDTQYNDIKKYRKLTEVEEQLQADSRLLIWSDFHNKRKDQTTKFAADQKAINDKNKQTALDALFDQFDTELEILHKEVKAEKDAADAKIEEEKRVRDFKRQARQAEIEEVQSFGNTIGALVEQSYTNRMDTMSKSYDEQIALVQQAGGDTTALEKQKNDEIAKLQKEAGNKKKAFALANLAIDTAQAIMGFWAVSPTTGNAVMAASFATAMTILTTMTAAAQTALILGTQYGKGGLLEGPSHAEGGIATPYGELEGNEGILNKRSMGIPALRNLASDINVMGGGVSFALPGHKNGSALESVSNQGITHEEAVNLIKEFAAIPVILVESDVTNSQRKVRTIETRSKI